MTFQTYFWIAFLYFFSGLPFGFFYTFLPVFFRINGLDLVKIGLFSSAGIFWSLKPLWAPLLDKYLSKKFWMGIALWGISGSILFLSSTSLEDPRFIFLLFSLTFFSALLDTALDGFIIEWVLPEKLGKANGIRVAFYRIALIFSGGFLTALTQYLEFKIIFYLLSFFTFLAGNLIFFSSSLSLKPIKNFNYSVKEHYLVPLMELFKRPSVAILLLFIASYKIGDAFLGGMVAPFWVDRGFNRVEIGFLAGVLGSGFTILGSLVGGYYTSRWGVKKALLIFGFLQALSNLGYTIGALPFVKKEFIYLASIIESFTGGLGTASFLTFLTFLCKKEFSATQYAIFSTLFSLTLVLARTLSGWGAKTLGYAPFFFLTFLIALIPLLLIPKLFRINERKFPYKSKLS
ncbi:MAG: MFS transporter [Thermodesulfobacteriaceae bacterium]|nr:MFS transporter [Thermodesulfobacteriaceae bacterium]MDW8136108.1 MFS transporter [Thermodesulfobacterium sp.]